MVLIYVEERFGPRSRRILSDLLLVAGVASLVFLLSLGVTVADQGRQIEAEAVKRDAAIAQSLYRGCVTRANPQRAYTRVSNQGTIAVIDAFTAAVPPKQRAASPVARAFFHRFATVRTRLVRQNARLGPLDCARLYPIRRFSP